MYMGVLCDWEKTKENRSRWSLAKVGSGNRELEFPWTHLVSGFMCVNLSSKISTKIWKDSSCHLLSSYKIWDATRFVQDVTKKRWNLYMSSASASCTRVFTCRFHFFLFHLKFYMMVKYDMSCPFIFFVEISRWQFDPRQIRMLTREPGTQVPRLI
jgi:hypothetical protein